MKWQKPKDEHIIYEAFSAIADNRFELTSETTAKSKSTSGNKYYSITYDEATNSIMSDDNIAYYRGEISYPMVAFFLVKGVISYDNTILENFKGIMWKDLNQKNRNNYMKSVQMVLDDLLKNGVDTNHILDEVSKIFEKVSNMELNYLGNKVVPSNVY